MSTKKFCIFPGTTDPEKLAAGFEGLEVDAVYINALATAQHGARAMGRFHQE